MNTANLASMGHANLASMDELWERRNKKNKNSQTKDVLMLGVPASNSMPVPKPNWNELCYVPTKNKNAPMSEEEFEEAIVALALKQAKSGNFSKDHEYYKLQADYISVVSPDRKAACNNYIRTPYDNRNITTVYGDFNQELMRYTHGNWGAVYTPEEEARLSKFWQIYVGTLRQYEAEHGQFSYNNSKTSSTSVFLDTSA